MAVRLNITMHEGIYRWLKRELPPKRTSAFVNEADRARLAPDRRTLDEACQAASREAWRREASEDWSATDVDGWPE